MDQGPGSTSIEVVKSIDSFQTQCKKRTFNRQRLHQMENASSLGCNLTKNVTGNWSPCPHSLSTPTAAMVNPYN